MAKSHTRSAPLEKSIHYLEQALETGIRGVNRRIIEDALQALSKNGSTITDAQYRNLRPGSTLADPDRPGFRMRANKGSKRWVYRYEWNGRQKELDLGTYPDTTLAKAREKWEKARNLRLQGKDPATRSDSDMPTVRELVQRYIDEYCRYVKDGELIKRSWKDDRRMLEKDMVSRFGDKPTDQLTAADLSLMFMEVKARSKDGNPRAAEKLYACVSTLFNVARGKTRKIEFLNGTWLPHAMPHPLEGVSLAKRDNTGDKTQPSC